MADQGRSSQPVSRIGVSLPPALLDQLDQMVAHRGYFSRSQAIGEMVRYQLAEHKRKLGNDVMVGTITLLYDRSVGDLQRRLADIQYQYIDEVVSSLHVHLSHDQLMEVILVQGHAKQLQAIANELITQRGVFTGTLQLLAAVIPPLRSPQPAPGKSATAAIARLRR